MIFSFCNLTLARRVAPAMGVLLSLVAASAFAQIPSNVYRPPNDNFNQVPRLNQTAPQRFSPQVAPGGSRVTLPQGQTFRAVPRQTPPGGIIQQTPQYSYPVPGPQIQTPVYQQPLQEVPGQVFRQPALVTPAQSPATSNGDQELKRSLVKARDLMQKFQLKMEAVSRRNQELEKEVATLQASSRMSDSNASEELVVAKATAAEAQKRASAINSELQNALGNLRTSTEDLDRQKQIGAALQEKVASLQKATQMAAGSDAQVAELTKSLQEFKSQNDALNGRMSALQNALRDKETQIAKMGSDEDAQVADLRQRFKAARDTNEQLKLKLKTAQAEAAKAAEMTAPPADPAVAKLREDNQLLGQQKQQLESQNSQLNEKLKAALAEAAEMPRPQADPAVAQLREDNQLLGQQKQQLESKNSQLSEMLGQIRSQKSQLEATVTRLSNVPAPVVAPPTEATGFVATPLAAAPTADLTELQNQLVSINRKNRQLERQVKLSKSKFETLTAENVRLKKASRTDASTKVAAAPVPVTSVKAGETSLAVASPAVALSSVSSSGSGLWPVKYWILGLLAIGVVVGLGVAWYESEDMKRLRQPTKS